MNCACIIPARFESSRLPGKPLKMIADKPMIQWVYQQAKKAERIGQVVVATDHERIYKTVLAFGGTAVMTSPEHASGTDRVAEAALAMDAEVIINVQGDEPFISPGLLDEMAVLFENDHIDVATPVHPIRDVDELTDPNLVRVVRDKNNFALYFSRSVIPFFRDESRMANWIVSHNYYKHIGLYAYRKDILLEITKLPVSSLEQAEKLEQLRMLEHGFRIYTHETEYESHCVDTEADLIHINKLIKMNRITLD